MSQTEIEESVIRDVLYECDIDPEEQMRTSYSGRAMYDDVCLGIICTLEDVLRVMFWLGEQVGANVDEESNSSWRDLADAMQQKASMDNMGYDTIWYFPKVKVVEG